MYRILVLYVIFKKNIFLHLYVVAMQRCPAVVEPLTRTLEATVTDFMAQPIQ